MTDESESDRLLRALVDQIKMGSYVEENGHQLVMNSAYLEALGYLRREPLNRQT